MIFTLYTFNMHTSLKKLQNKKIAILGLGIENQALLKYLLKNKIETDFTICDQRSREELVEKMPELIKYKNIQWRLRADFNQRLHEFDILFRAPGWPLNCPEIREAKKKNSGIIISSPMKLFFELCPSKNIIGVTGTKGKGTTSSLIAQILKTAKKKVWLGGNIGVAPFAFLEQVKKIDWVVLELSSFQLEDLHLSPHIAVVTNFTPEHLAPADPHNPNYHKSLRAYREAKENIFKWQGGRDYFVVNSKTQDARYKIAERSLGKRIYFSKSELKSKLVGEHNRENIAAAEVVAKIVGIKKEVVARAVKIFRGLEHRTEFVREIGDVQYYDDSFATTPDSAIIALKSFQAPIILLAGGADKGANFQILAKEIKKRVKFVILFTGKGTEKIKAALKKAQYSPNKILTVSSMPEAISYANQASVAGDIILLSPGCASFGVFKNYKERGSLFKKEVRAIK